MTDDQIIAHLKSGETLTFGCHGRNRDVLDLMGRLESQGAIETWDASLSQETRRSAKWIAFCLYQDCGAVGLHYIEGEWLCQEHANEWSAGEGIAAQEFEQR
jgi:hypothetical protein